MKVLLSIKPEFAEKIISGEKRFEYRKAIFKNPRVEAVVIYATRPTAKIVGEFSVAEIVRGTPDYVWKLTGKFGGITKEFFYDYFSGRKTAFALGVGVVREYEVPLDPGLFMKNFVAPQSYMYLDGPARLREQNLDLFSHT